MSAPITSNRALVRAQAGARAELIAMYRNAAQQARLRLLSAGNGDNPIPVSQREDIQRDIGEIFQRLFVGADGRRAFAADNRALAPFGDILNRWSALAVGEAVAIHTRWLSRHTPPDVLAWLRRPIVRELSNVTIDPGNPFKPNPLAEYEPLHTWIDPNGYQLSDRVWQAGIETRRKIDAILAEGIRRGDGALTIAARLEQFVRPDTRPLRTKAPYGTDASYPGMRLARSEIGRAFSWATIVSARANPYVESLNYNLSIRHPRYDICDEYAAASPHPVNDCPVPVQSSHPNCICHLSANVRPVGEVSAELRAMLEDRQQPPYITPADQNGFITLLLGAVLADMARRMMQTFTG